MGRRRGGVNAPQEFYQPQRIFYSLAPSRRPAIAVVRLQQGRGTDLAEVDFALRMLKRRLQRGGYYQDLARVAIAGRGKRRKYKAARARRRLAKTLSRAARREASRPD